MLVIGLTGSIGMGKSTIAQGLRDRGLAVCDADAEVHKLYQGAAVAPVEAAFPGSTELGSINRAKLAAVLLTDPAGFKRLEQIVHPLVFEAERQFLLAEHARGARIAVLEIPLLLEGGGEKRVDATIVVSAPAALQRERVLLRPGMTEEKLAVILSRQMSDAEKRRRADFIVDTGGTIAHSLEQLVMILASLDGREGSAFAEFWQRLR